MILLVDDDEDVRSLVAEVLGTDRVIEAANGSQALKILRSGAPIQLVLCDLAMPVMDGEEFCAEWKKDPALASIPVVLMSGERDIREIHDRLGTMGYLQKPVDLDVLETAIEKYALRRVLASA